MLQFPRVIFRDGVGCVRERWRDEQELHTVLNIHVCLYLTDLTCTPLFNTRYIHFRFAFETEYD